MNFTEQEFRESIQATIEKHKPLLDMFEAYDKRFFAETRIDKYGTIR